MNENGSSNGSTIHSRDPLKTILRPETIVQDLVIHIHNLSLKTLGMTQKADRLEQTLLNQNEMLQVLFDRLERVKATTEGLRATGDTQVVAGGTCATSNHLFTLEALLRRVPGFQGKTKFRPRIIIVQSIQCSETSVLKIRIGEP